MARVELTDHGWLRIQKELKAMQKHHVVVGVLGRSGSDLVNIAAYNHFGTSRGIPAVPFLNIAVEKNKTGIKRFTFASVGRVFAGSNAITEFKLLGLYAEGIVKKTMRDIRTPKNAPSTIKQKGFDNRLIWSGRLLNSIASEVRKNA